MRRLLRLMSSGIQILETSQKFSAWLGAMQLAWTVWAGAGPLVAGIVPDILMVTEASTAAVPST